MVINPDFGLRISEWALRSWDCGLQPGWNRLPVISDESSSAYVYIGPDGGLTTRNPPAGDEAIHEAKGDAPPPLISSQVWRNYRHDSASLHRSGLLETETLESATSSIFAASAQHLDLDHLVARWRDGIESLQRSLLAAASGESGYDEFQTEFDHPVLSLIEDYLSFKIPGALASEVLGALLSAQCIIPRLWPPTLISREAQLAAVEHLAEVSWSLLSSRRRMNVQGYYEATYLAGLYARTACRIASWSEPWEVDVTQEGSRLAKLSLNMEELYAHKIAPVFILPALFPPAVIGKELIERAAVHGSDLMEEFEYFQTHPALRTVILECLGKDLASCAVDDEFRRASDAMEGFDAREALAASASPFSRKNREVVGLGFLSAEIGRRRGA